jgi:hypothetical protein
VLTGGTGKYRAGLTHTHRLLLPSPTEGYCPASGRSPAATRSTSTACGSAQDGSTPVDASVERRKP